MVKLADPSGVIIYENQNKVFVCKKAGTWISTLLFVTGILSIILLGNALLQLFVFENEFNLSNKPGIILFSAGVFFVVIFWRILLYKRKFNYIPLSELKTICIFDLINNNLLDGQHNILSPLNNVFLLGKMQLTSSSPELLLQWKTGSLTIVKGNPFSGGVRDIEKILIAKGIKRK